MTREELLDLIQERVPQLRDEAERVLDVILSAGEKRWDHALFCRLWPQQPLSDELGNHHCPGRWVVVLPASLGEQP